VTYNLLNSDKNVQVSDTTGVDSSTNAGNIKHYSHFRSHHKNVAAIKNNIAKKYGGIIF